MGFDKKARPGSRRLKWFVAGVLVLASGVLLVAGQLECAGRRALARALRDARAAGLPMSIADLEVSRPRPADDENMALRLLAEADAIEAWLRSEEGSGLVGDLPGFGGPGMSTLPRRLAPKELAAAHVFLRANRQHLNAIHHAAGMKQGMYLIGWATSASKTRFPHLERHRTVVHSLVLATLVALERRDMQAARQHIEDILKVDRALEHEPFFLGNAVSLWSRRLAIRLLEHALARGTLTDGDLVALQNAIRTCAGRYDIRRIISAECLLLLDGQRLAWTAPSEELPFYAYRCYPGRKDNNLAAWLRAGVEASAAAELPPLKALAWYRRWEETGPPISQEYALARTAADFMRPAHFVEQTMCIKALSRTADAALALERYRLTNGTWPKELSELVPAFIDAVPADPFAEQPMRYGRHENGVRIWSIGPDLTDDGGQVGPTDDGTEPADVGFRLLDR